MPAQSEERAAVIHPGEVLRDRFMKPLGLSINKLARDLDVPPNRIHGIIHGKRSVTADTALRLAAYFDVSAESWLGLQLDYELRVARRLHGDDIARAVRKPPKGRVPE